MTFRIHVDQTFVRDELRFSVRVVSGTERVGRSGPIDQRRPERWAALLAALREVERPLIIYTMSRREAEDLAQALPAATGMTCASYHAGLTQLDRQEVEDRFLQNELDCIVATNAFGMGIDKSDVRAVIHWQLPATPEALYQEAGRAGRSTTADGPAHAVLLFHPADLEAAYRTSRQAVPTRWEITRTDIALRELSDHQGRTTITITDEDLRRLAVLRPSVEPRVVLGLLEQSGLVRELDRQSSLRVVRRSGPPPTEPTALERVLLDLVPDNGECVPVPARQIADRLDDTTTDVRRALADLERRGVLEPCRRISIRWLEDDVPSLVGSSRDVALRVWRNLGEHGERHGSRRFQRGLGAVAGDLDATRAAIEVLAAFGLVEVRHESADSSLPAVRLGRTRDTSKLRAAFAACGSLHEVLSATTSSEMKVDDVAAGSKLDRRAVENGLTLLHLIGAASVDLRSWEDGGATVRTLEVRDVPDRDQLIADAIADGVERARLGRLRLEVLNRYSSLDPGDPADDADPYQAFLERYLTKRDFLEEVAAETNSDLVSNLTDTQRDVVQAPPSESIVILAGPGTGKTRTVVSRIAYRVRAGYVLPERVLAITFTRAATEEVRARLAQLGVRGVNVRTLDSLAWWIVRENWAAMGLSAEPTLISDEEALRLMREACRYSAREGAVPTAELRALALSKSRRLPLEELHHLRYQRLLDDHGLVDFGDVKRLASRFLLLNRRARHYLEGVDEVYVDEFQDLSPLQVELCDAISQLAHLTIVGDPRQAIYEWNGASPRELIHRHASGNRSFDLTESFRSTPPILGLANRVMSKVLPQLPPMRSRAGVDGPAVTQTGASDTETMLGHVAQTVGSWLAAGVPDSEIAVLTYTNSKVTEIVRALRQQSIAAHEAGLPRLDRTVAFAALASAIDRDDDSHPEESPLDRFDRLEQSASVLHALAGRSDREHAENSDDWERLRGALDEILRESAATLQGALTTLRRNAEGPARRSGVTVTTMTRAKGLEWDAVAVTDLGSDFLKDRAADPEMGRLVYVAVTRARRHLDLSWSRRRTKWLD